MRKLCVVSIVIRLNLLWLLMIILPLNGTMCVFAHINVEMALCLVDQHLGQHLPYPRMFVARKSARCFVFGNAKRLFRTYGRCCYI